MGGQSSGRGRTRRQLAGGASALAAGVLGACAPGASSSSPAATPQERGGALLFMTYGGDPERMNAYNAMVRTFQAEHPAYQVQVVPPAAGNYYDRLYASIAGNQPVDVVGAGSPQDIPALATKGAFLDLTARTSRDKAFKPNDYLGGIVDGGTYRQKLYGITLSIATSALYYNKDAFDKAGLPYPDAAWNWERLRTAAQGLTRRTDSTAEQFGLALSDDLINMLYWIWSNGGEVYDRQEDPTRSTMTSPPTLQAVELSTDLRARHRVTPTSRDQGFAFLSGNVAMALSNITQLAQITSRAQFRWDVAPRPRGPRGNVDRIGGEMYGVGTTSRLPDGAFELWKTVVGPVGVRAYLGLNVVPTLKALHREYEALPAPPTRKVITETLNSMRALPKTPKSQEIELAGHTTQFRAAFLGEKSASQACEAIDQAVNAILRS
jgi:multiple sugar transport system substrate-binding protein